MTPEPRSLQVGVTTDMYYFYIEEGDDTMRYLCSLTRLQQGNGIGRAPWLFPGQQLATAARRGELGQK